MGIAMAFLAYVSFFAPGDRDLSGDWTAEVDMTGQAAVIAYGWLQDMEAVSVTPEEVESYLQDVTVQVDLTMEQTHRSGGIFRCNVLPESYDACNQAAYEAFATAFRELVAERLRMAGYNGGTDREAVEALITETFGMSTVSYLMSCGPALLPSLEALQARYDGSGTYEAMDGILVRQFEGDGAMGIRQERYIRKGSDLVFVEETGDSGQEGDSYPILFTLKPSAD